MVSTNITSISVRNLTDGYKSNTDEGIRGFKGKLDIRPPYQREFIYNNKQRELVIDTVMKDATLGLFHWGQRDDGTYEIIDGQQRTISLCQYVNGDFSYNGRYFHNLAHSEQEEILNHEILVAVFNGDEKQKLEWFERINIAGETLTKQELRNAVYHGPWLYDAKRYFSKPGCPAYKIAGDYMKGSPIRQDYLESALDWISNGRIEEYMGIHQHDKDAKHIWRYFEDVMDWVKGIFTTYRSEMKGLPWGEYYNTYNGKEFNPIDVGRKVDELYEDIEIKNNKGIYPYILSGDSVHLNLRTFEPHIKKAIYEKQNGICLHCGAEYDIKDMHADHIMPWSLGGKTVPENCQILCKNCNARKSNNY